MSNLERDKSYSLKELAVDEYKFSGYLSTYGNADRVGDVIEKGAFEESVQNKSTVAMLFNHDRNKVIGKLHLFNNSKGLKVEGELNPEIEQAKEVYSNLKFGALSEMSIGMQIKEYEPIDKEKPYGAWKIKKADVLEGSVVTIPANPEAKIEAVKELQEKEDTKRKQALINAIKTI